MGSARSWAFGHRPANTALIQSLPSALTWGDLGAALLTEGVEEPLKGGLLPAGCSPHQPAGVVVDHHGQVPLPTFVGDLVDPDPTEVGEPVVHGLDVGPDPGDDRTHAAPIVNGATRISSVIAVLEHWVADQATCSSKT
jgi:hypothetical protein